MAASSSVSECLHGMAAALDALRTEDRAIPEDALRALVGAITRLYGTAAARNGREPPLAGPGVSATDAVVLCCALLRAQDLTPFDLTLWFGRSAPESQAG